MEIIQGFVTKPLTKDSVGELLAGAIPSFTSMP